MILSLLLFVIATGCYAVKELSAHGKLKWGKDAFWGEQSYLNKYKQPLIAPLDGWYSSFFVLKYKERFPGSATLFVAFTDGMHLMQACFKIFLCVSIVLYRPWQALYIDAFLYYIVFGITFTVVYRWLSA